MSKQVRNILLGLLMLLASGIALALRPNIYLADTQPELNLETLIPHQFNDWKALKQQAQIVNPQRQQNLNKFYTQILTRTYINNKGARVMLSIAYGRDQSDEKQVHYPEVCYPSQGFRVLSNQIGAADTDFGVLPVKRLVTKLRSRVEPITYWTTVGNQLALTGYEAKKAQLAYGFKGYIPDGLIFRVSSIDPNAKNAFKTHQIFINDLLENLDPKERVRLSGINRN